VVFGQNPGFNECVIGEPFVGQAGNTFDKEIEKYGFNRDYFYISNVVHCYTEKNRAPLPDEIRSCNPIILIELQIIKPKLIITLGKPAFQIFCPNLNYSDSLGDICKSKVNGRGYKVFPIYHPSGLNLSSKLRKTKFEEDIKMLCLLIKELEKKECLT